MYDAFIDKHILIILLLFLLIIYFLWILYKKSNSKKKYIYGGLLIFIIPITLILLLKNIVFYMPGTTIGSIDGWLGFLGGYTGALLALGGIYFQILEDKKSKVIENKKQLLKQKQNILKYLEYNLIKNKDFFLYNNYKKILDCIPFVMFSHKSKNKIYPLNSEYIQSNINTILSLETLGYYIIDFNSKINEFIISHNYLIENFEKKIIILDNVTIFLKELLKNNNSELISNRRFSFNRHSIEIILPHLNTIKSLSFIFDDYISFIETNNIPSTLISLIKNNTNDECIKMIENHLNDKDSFKLYVEINIFIMTTLRKILHYLELDSNLYLELNTLVKHIEKIFDNFGILISEYDNLKKLIPDMINDLNKIEKEL